MRAAAEAILCLEAAALMLCPAARAQDPPQANPLALSSYYVWYRDGTHPQWPWSNWTRREAEENAAAKAAQRPGEPPLSSSACPLAGLYDSGDPGIAEWHVKLAKAAGVVEPSSSWPDPYLYLKIPAGWKGRPFKAPEGPKSRKAPDSKE